MSYPLHPAILRPLTPEETVLFAAGSYPPLRCTCTALWLCAACRGHAKAQHQPGGSKKPRPRRARRDKRDARGLHHERVREDG